ncbi:MAG: protein translocase subunit SecF [Candidatus Paceibacterota bacterium]|jgi:preprotein translocase subunit SecF
MKIVKYRKIFYIISGILVLASIASISIWGLNLGIDFKGGSLLEISYTGTRPEIGVIKDALKNLNLGDFSVRTTRDTGYIVRAREISQPEKVQVLNALAIGGQKITEERFDSIGPVLGKEAASKSVTSIILVMLAIVLFITFAFRKVSEPVSSWKYGLVAVLALVHDVLIPTGVFAILGHFKGVEVDTLFVTAILVVLGFSVHDTIVVFDRVRENLRRLKESNGRKDFETVVGESVSQTFTRSINTSLTTLLALIVLYFVGGEATKLFSLALIIGVVVGTYSSIFIGSPLLVTLERLKNRRK